MQPLLISALTFSNRFLKFSSSKGSAPYKGKQFTIIRYRFVKNYLYYVYLLYFHKLQYKYFDISKLMISKLNKSKLRLHFLFSWKFLDIETIFISCALKFNFIY